jgi:hypothetical protein
MMKHDHVQRQARDKHRENQRHQEDGLFISKGVVLLCFCVLFCCVCVCVAWQVFFKEQDGGHSVVGTWDADTRRVNLGAAGPLPSGTPQRRRQT